MRSTIVPAQVTTVEDRVAGKLGLSQLLLLVTPIFGGSLTFILLPPFFDYATYKIVLIVIIAVISGLLAIRFRGRIILQWVATIIRFNLRPRYYVHDKNSIYMRDIPPKHIPKETTEPEKKEPILQRLPNLSTAELVRIEEIIANPQANLRFKANRKGGLSVHITEIK